MADGIVSLPNQLWGKFQDGFNNGISIANDIKSKLDNLLGPLLTKLDDLTGGLISTILSIPNTIFNLFKVPLDGISWLLNYTYEAVRYIPEKIDQILSYLNPFSDTFILKIAFVPTASNRSEMLIDKLSQKFGDINDLITTFESLKTYEETGQAPVFKLNFNGVYGVTGEYNVIDFQFYEQYRPWIHSFTIMVAWIYFIKRLINYLPDIVY